MSAVFAVDGAGWALGVLADVSLQATVVFAVAGAADALLRGSGAARHRLWAAAFAAVAVLPGLASGHPVALSGASVLLAIWALGAVLAAGPWLLGWRRLSAATRAMQPVSARLELPARARVGTTDRFVAPLTFGAWRPVVLLPAGFAAWPADRRRQTLLHEAAHIRRLDWLVQAGVRAVCCALWFHPLAWWAARRLALQAECAADEQVLDAGVRPSEYASLLLTLGAARPVSASALSARSHLELRVRSLVAPSRRRGLPILGVAAVLALPAALSGLTLLPPPVAVAHCLPSAAFAGEVENPTPQWDGTTATVAPHFEHLLGVLRGGGTSQGAYHRGAVGELVRTCPYNRATAQIPFVVDRVLQEHRTLLDDARRDSPGISGQLATLQGALDAHLAVLDHLGLQLGWPPPMPGDYLQDEPPLRGETRAELLAATEAALARVQPLVDAYDEPTKARIDEALAIVDAATLERWPFKGELIAYRTTLIELSGMASAMRRRGHPELQTRYAALQADCDALIALLDTLFQQRC